MANLTVFVPLRVSPEDALTLSITAKSQQETRSEILRKLIRSLENPRSPKPLKN